jgi:lipopolysaccharide transport system permease protein
LDLKRLWSFRKYILANAWNNMRYQYAGTGLGALWNLLNPIIEVAIYAVVFSQIMGMRGSARGGSDYVIFLVSGLFPWLSFSETLLKGSNAFSTHARYMRYHAIPPEVSVIINTVTSFYRVLIYMVIVSLLALLSGLSVGWAYLLLIPLSFLFQLLGFGIALMVAGVRFLLPDLGEVLEAIVQIWRWLLPIMYTIDNIPKKYHLMFQIDPPYYFLNAYRSIITKNTIPDINTWMIMAAFALVFVLIGSWVHQFVSSDVRDNL